MGDAEIAGGGKGVRPSQEASVARYTASGIPASPDYAIETVLRVHSLDVGPIAGVLGRFDPKALTGYEAVYDGINLCWRLMVWLVGEDELLGRYDERLEPGTYDMVFRLEGDVLSMSVDGEEKITLTAGYIGEPGRVGVMLYQQRDVGDNTGIHIDGFTATDL